MSTKGAEEGSGRRIKKMKRKDENKEKKKAREDESKEDRKCQGDIHRDIADDQVLKVNHL